MKWLLLALFLVASAAGAVPLNLSVLAPSTNDDNNNCNLAETDSGWVYVDNGSPLTDLKEILVYGKRFVDADTTLTIVPAVGMEGQWIPFSLNYPGGSMGTVWTKARDFSGNVSCKGAEHLFVIPMLPEPAQTGTGLRGQYYTYDRWNDFKTFLGERVDSTINFDYGAGAAWPGGPSDYFSIRWTGTLNVPYSGSWTLYLDHKDGVRLWINGVLLQNYWFDTSGETASELWLPAGRLDINVEYYAGYSSSRCKMYWSEMNTPKQIIPTGVLDAP